MIIQTHICLNLVKKKLNIKNDPYSYMFKFSKKKLNIYYKLQKCRSLIYLTKMTLN